jgi:drug/metabolite transporter (DMT)-like permease
MMCWCNVGFIVALQRIDAATVLFLQCLAPFSAAGLGWLVHRERTDRHTWCSMALAVAGVAIMGSGWQAADPIGVLAAALQPVMLGGYAVVLRGTGESAPEPRLQLLLSSLLGLAVAVPVAVATASDGAYSLSLPPRDILCALTAGAGCTGIGLALYSTAGAHVPAARATLLLLTEVRCSCVFVL